ncbi:MAG TPA: L,D-transpeptidase family protein [Solirubrobacteraceae bacterium]|nr:L,D-transpeptidase family protein [Solirubrobacteraceae bacterium]
MRRARIPRPLAAAALATLAAALLFSAAPGLAARVHAASAAPTQTPTTTTTPATPTPAPAAPAPAPTLKLVVQHAGGSPAFAIVGSRILVRGYVRPYVAGQRVKISFYRDGRRLVVRTLGLSPRNDGSGEFHVTFVSHYAGLVQARAVHYATAALPLISAQSEKVRFTHTELAEGSSGASVLLLQSELYALHYSVPINGNFEEATGRAVIAFRKLAGLERVPYADRGVFEALARGEGPFTVRFARDGRHVEADLTKQVLAEIESGGRVHAIYEMSSGKPSTPTVIGHFYVYSKTLGVNQKGMVDSNYFIRGYAIHGYPEVPVYAASHGCLRVPIPNASSIFGWVQLGTAVDVYNESGGGSHSVSGHAGP